MQEVQLEAMAILFCVPGRGIKYIIQAMHTDFKPYHHRLGSFKELHHKNGLTLT